MSRINLGRVEVSPEVALAHRLSPPSQDDLSAMITEHHSPAISRMGDLIQMMNQIRLKKLYQL